jgi:hypothetical protein
VVALAIAATSAGLERSSSGGWFIVRFSKLLFMKKFS